MLKHNLGYPRMGAQRQLKKACEQYWSGKISREDLFLSAQKIREDNWHQQVEAGMDLVPAGDFSFYDHVLDMTFLLGATPRRYSPVLTEVKDNTEIDLYFAMARGYQKDGLDITAMEMTKWFDTNYHYIVPEFTLDQSFSIFSNKLFGDFAAARHATGKIPKPVLIGPVSYLLLGKEKDPGFHRIDLIRRLVPVYIEILKRLDADGAAWVQLDEPFLGMDLSEAEAAAFRYAYDEIRKHCPDLKLLVATYFNGLEDNTDLALKLPICALHLDLVRSPNQLETILPRIPKALSLSLGVVDGRNIWKNDYDQSLALIEKAVVALGVGRVFLAPSCSLLHTPLDLHLEKNIQPEIGNWMAFARQKLQEVSELDAIASAGGAAVGQVTTPVAGQVTTPVAGQVKTPDHPASGYLSANRQANQLRRTSALIHRPVVAERVATLTSDEAFRPSAFPRRQQVQQDKYKLPLFPTTTIGSFPQTEAVREWRAKFKKGLLTQAEYDTLIEQATLETIRWQEEIGLDVLVHGEFERNDMVEYFGEQLDGFLFTQYGWVQSYGSRCVKPPVIFGDVSRPRDMTVRWSRFSQAATKGHMKGMLTGPVTILQWSFVRDDQPRSLTAFQIALAIRDEVLALEQAGIGIIQIDEPAIREGLPLRKKDRPAYLDWAVKAFRISASAVREDTQIHTHMCYSDFNDIIEHIAKMDADVITIETSRSQMDLLEAFSGFSYPNEIGPGVYDIHSPRVPSVAEMVDLLDKAAALLPAGNLWVNPDCGLKTRKWPETRLALENMVKAAKVMRTKVVAPHTH